MGAYITKLQNKNIWDTNADVITIPVNTVGVMGKGLALQCKERYPFVFAIYKEVCKNGSLTTQRPCFVTGGEKNFLLFATKEHWKNPSKLEYIVDGLNYLCKYYQAWDIKSIAIPSLGCGLGGLNINDVYPVMYDIIKHTNMTVEFYIDKRVG